MTPKMKSAIEKITLNAATFSGDVFEPTFINFFYGRNGAGKSTIAQSIGTNNGLLWQDGKSVADYDVLVYDQDFINNNLQNYGNLAGVFTVCDTNIEIQKQVEKKTADRSAFGEQFKTLTAAATSKSEEMGVSLSTFQNVCWEKSKSIRASFDEAMKNKKRIALFAEAILAVPTSAEHDLTSLKKMYDIAFDTSSRAYKEFSRAGSSTTYGKLPGKDLMDKPIVSSSESPFTAFMKALHATDWVRQGRDHYATQADGKCPFCQQKLPVGFDDEIAACFDAQYQKDIDDIAEFQATYIRETSAILDTLQANLQDVLATVDLVEYKDKIALLKSSIEINKQRIAGKVKEPTSIVALEDTDSLLIEIGTIIDDINRQIKANNDVVNDKKAKKTACVNQVWEHLAFMLSCEVTNYKSEQARLKKEADDLTAKATAARRAFNAATGDIAELNKQVVNTQAAIASINALLKDSGFQGFSLREKVGVPNVYEVIREDGSIAVKLSEGERNFIAFLYFYHLVRGSHSSDGVKDKIVVIDDPVSSMDSNTLFIVSAIIREMVEVCYNNTDYRDNTVQGDYIKQIFILTHNVYFHREITYRQVSRYKSVSFYMIHKTGNVSTVQLCDRECDGRPTEKENYNPVQNSYAALWDEFKTLKSTIPLLNVIRRILEYYFLQLCGYDGTDIRKIVLEDNREKFIIPVEGGQPANEKYQLASAMLTYINNPQGISDGLNYVEDCVDPEHYKTVFKLIFDSLDQSQHYNMMMGKEA